MLALVLALAGHAVSAGRASAQITSPRILSASVDRFATLEEQLVNRLRATTLERKSFIRFIVEQVRKGRLEPRLVVAVERYALRRKPSFPFPFFERAIRFEASKVGVSLPPVRLFASTAVPSVKPPSQTPKPKSKKMSLKGLFNPSSW